MLFWEYDSLATCGAAGCMAELSLRDDHSNSIKINLFFIQIYKNVIFLHLFFTTFSSSFLPSTQFSCRSYVHTLWCVLVADGIPSHTIWINMILAVARRNIVHRWPHVWYREPISKQMALSCIKLRWYSKGKLVYFLVSRHPDPNQTI